MGKIEMLTDAVDSPYVILDVETANPTDKGSICSIGLVRMNGTQMIDTFYSLVRPLSEFAPQNIKIHGIRPEDVASAPTFSALWPHLSTYMHGHTLVCYNASFDVYAIERALYNASLEIPNYRYACALKLSKRLLNLESYKLTAVASHFGYEYNSHNALEDAAVTARVVSTLMQEQGTETLNGLMRVACLPYEYTLTNEYEPSTDRPRNVQPYHVPKPLKCGNSSRFEGRCVVFSGNLTFATRDMAHDVVLRMGGVCKTSVSRKTDVLVFGFYDHSTLLPGSSFGSKLVKALELKQQGHHIEILDENEFMEILREGT